MFGLLCIFILWIVSTCPNTRRFGLPILIRLLIIGASLEMLHLWILNRNL